MICSHAQSVRNVALVGHGAAGKTTLAEHLLFRAGDSSRLGSVDEGTSLLDVDDEERQHHFSISSHLAHFDHAGHTINLIDTPGYPDFIGQVIGALRGVETACIVVNATAGIEVNTRRVFRLAGEAGLGRLIVINKLDLENVRFPELIESLQATFGRSCVLLNVPDGLGANFTRVISTLDLPETVPAGMPLSPQALHQQLMDAIVECDEELMNRYLEGERFDQDEIYKAVEHAMAIGCLIPIVCCSGRTGVGILELMDVLAHEALSPADVQREAVSSDGEPHAIEPDDHAQLVAQVIKTRIDPFVSKMSYLRLFSGRLAKEQTVVDMRTGRNLKIGNLYRIQGGTSEPVDQALPGDIVAVVKMDELRLGDTLTDGKNGQYQMPPMQFPHPMISLGIEPRSRNDQQKISGALHKIEEEDPTFHSEHESQTHELVIRGLSELHLKIVEERLQRREKVEVVTHPPRIPYRETINAEAKGMYRHKKQTGGAGQFGEVHLELYPFPAGTDPQEFVRSQFAHYREFRLHPESNFLFVDTISGGSIPNQYIPAIEKGILEQIARGVLAGSPIQDLCVNLHFGKYHDVDSNENAFRTAGAQCFKLLFNEARPQLLEPIVKIEILVPSQKLGEITSDLNSRRGRIEALDSLPGDYQIVTAKVPLSQVATYSRTLSSLTGGLGSFTLELSHYEPMLPYEQAKVVSLLQRDRPAES